MIKITARTHSRLKWFTFHREESEKKRNWVNARLDHRLNTRVGVVGISSEYDLNFKKSAIIYHELLIRKTGIYFHLSWHILAWKLFLSGILLLEVKLTTASCRALRAICISYVYKGFRKRLWNVDAEKQLQEKNAKMYNCSRVHFRYSRMSGKRLFLRVTMAFCYPVSDPGYLGVKTIYQSDVG